MNDRWYGVVRLGTSDNTGNWKGRGSFTLAVVFSIAAALPGNADDVFRQTAPAGAPGLAGQPIGPASYVLSTPARVTDFGYLLTGGAGGQGLGGTAGSNGVNGTTIGNRATAPTRAFVQTTSGADGTNGGDGGDGGDVTRQSVLIARSLEAPKGGVHITAGSGGTGGRGGAGGEGGSVADLADWRDLLRTNLPGSFINDGLQGAAGGVGGAGETGGTGGAGGILQGIVVNNRAAITSQETAIALRSGDGGAGGRGGDSGDGGDAADGAIRGVTPGQPNVLDGADAADRTGSNRLCPTRNNVLRCGVRGRGGLFGNIVAVSNPFAEGATGGDGGVAGAGGLGSSGGDLLDARVTNEGRLTVSGPAGADGILLQAGQGGDGGRGGDGGAGGKGGRGSDGLHGSNGGDGGDGGDGQDGGVSGLDPIAGYNGGNGGDGADGILGANGTFGGRGGDSGLGGIGGAAGAGGSVAGARLTNSGTIRATRDGIRIIAGAGGRGGNAGDSGRAGLGGDRGNGGRGGLGGKGGAGGKGGDGGCVVIGVPPAAFTRCASDGNAGAAGSDGEDRRDGLSGLGGDNGATWTVFSSGSGGQGGSVRDNLIVNSGQITVLGDGLSFSGGGGGAVGNAGAAGIAPSTTSLGGDPGPQRTLNGSASVGAGGDVIGNTVRNSGTIAAQNTGIVFAAGVGAVAGQVKHNRVFNAQSGVIRGATGVWFGAGTDNAVETSGVIEGTAGTALRFTSGSNLVRLGSGSVTRGDVVGGSGDDVFVLENAAKVTGVLAGNGAVTGDTLKLEFKRVLPTEMAALKALSKGDGAFTFRFEPYRYSSIEVLDLSDVQLSNFEQYGAHPERKAFGRMLDHLPFVTPDLDAVLTQIDTQIRDKDAALRQLMPEVYDVARVQQMHMARARGAPPGGAVVLAPAGRRAKAAHGRGLQVWVDGGFDARSASYAGDPDLTFSAQSRQTRVGFQSDLAGSVTQLWGYVGLSHFEAEAGRSDVAGRSTTVGFGLRHRFADRLFVQADLSYGWDRYEVDRAIAIGTLRDTARASYDGTHLGASLHLGLAAGQAGGFRFAPRIGFDYVALDADAFKETGAGDLDLAVDAQSHRSLDLVAGLDAQRVFAIANGGSVTLDMGASVRLNLDQENRYAAALARIPGSNFAMETDNDDTGFAALKLRLVHRPAHGSIETFVEWNGHASIGQGQSASAVQAGFAISF
ncbi:MAG: hypothetical protein AAFQ19_16805 [Pseudomonadota bacterium]